MRKQVQDITMATTTALVTAPVTREAHCNEGKGGGNEESHFRRARFFRWRTGKTVIDKTAIWLLLKIQ